MCSPSSLHPALLFQPPAIAVQEINVTSEPCRALNLRQSEGAGPARLRSSFHLQRYVCVKTTGSNIAPREGAGWKESDLKSSGCLLSRERAEERSEAPGVSDQWRRKKRIRLLGGLRGDT